MKQLGCHNCSNLYDVNSDQWKAYRYNFKKKGVRHFCSEQCREEVRGYSKPVTCKQCNTSFNKEKSRIEKSKNNFCSSSCNATYNNTHKTKGTRRSKLEVYLEKRLTEIYPDLEILYSDKTTIKSELDFYIPSLNLAFELNGIFHYEPIYGKDKLEKIQNNDHRKFQACLEQGIELCIIDSSGQKYLNIITNLVDSKLESSKTDYVEVL
jgi:hypothetical protein